MVAFVSNSDQLQTKAKTEATNMKRAFEDKIPAAVRRQAREIAKYSLLPMGKNSLHNLFSVLMTVIEAAASSSSIEMKSGSPDADTVFYHLQKLSVQKAEEMLLCFVERAIRLAKRRFGNRKLAIAIDYTEEMYYGEKGNPSVVGTKHKNGSNFAYRFLTVNIVVAGCRFFVLAYPAFERGNYLYVGKVLDVLEKLGLKTYALLLDREFNDAATLHFLQSRDYGYVIPADQNSKFERWKMAAERFPAIFRGWEVAGVQTTLVMLEEEGQVYGYFTNLPEDFYKDDAYRLSFLYSKRWGIETAHRVGDRFRIRTTCKNGILRYFFFVVAILLYNLWVWVNLTFGLTGGAALKVEELKEILQKSFEEFLRWLSSPERWFSVLSDGNGARAVFCQPATAGWQR